VIGSFDPAAFAFAMKEIGNSASRVARFDRRTQAEIAA